ncbi:hypothetical protein [Couchioplanes caeruleus]|uniref:Uncharacterized protein n=2 Tax=Couchioplanes caeruleus TaxID=56438 RepID=A0A1K0F952_9ACTN|nr:hypothetical protein [Couchioplanes caeruleus]OJF09381.1 hypothetical protein BG844_37940 [Couchioplanes caeruleus subsp. caeruleus]ROP29559.1 hypothetical protein EDD30_2360 [Couchioplanes caeruleus]
MRLFRRVPKLPADKRPPLEDEERVLAWAATEGDGVLVATNRGLWLPDGRRLGWHEIHKAAWSGRELRITPAEVAQERNGYTVLVDAPVAGFLLLEPGELPDQVRTRVTRSVAYTSHHPLPPNGGVRVVGRRISGADGLSWAVRYDAKTAVEADPIIEATDQLVASAQEATAPPAA